MSARLCLSGHEKPEASDPNGSGAAVDWLELCKRGTKYISTVQRPIVKNVVGADDK